MLQPRCWKMTLLHDGVGDACLKCTIASSNSALIYAGDCTPCSWANTHTGPYQTWRKCGVTSSKSGHKTEQLNHHGNRSSSNHPAGSPLVIFMIATQEQRTDTGTDREFFLKGWSTKELDKKLQVVEQGQARKKYQNKERASERA